MATTNPERHPFRTTCPNGHEIWLALSAAEARASGDYLTFRCPTCELYWTPTPGERVGVLRYLSIYLAARKATNGV